MTDVPEGPTDLIREEIMRKLTEYVPPSSRRSQEGGASSSKLKEPKKEKNKPNKKVEALKKRAANERAKYLKTVQELKDLELLVKLERRQTLAQKRISMLEQDKKTIQMLQKKVDKELINEASGCRPVAQSPFPFSPFRF